MMTEPTNPKPGWEVFAETLVGLVSALAWPALIFFIILYFQGSIKELLSRVKTASIAGNTVDFRDELQEVSVEIKKEAAERQSERGTGGDLDGESRTPEDATADRMTSKVMNTLFELGSISPASAVLEAFKYVENEWNLLLESRGFGRRVLRYSEFKNFAQLVGLPPSVIDSYGRLRELRNKVAHMIDHKISATDSAEYVISAFQLAELFRGARSLADNDSPKEI